MQKKRWTALRQTYDSDVISPINACYYLLLVPYIHLQAE